MRWYTLVSIFLLLILIVVLVIYYPNLRSLYWGSNGVFNDDKSDTYIEPKIYSVTWIDGYDNSVLVIDNYECGNKLVWRDNDLPVHEGYKYLGYTIDGHYNSLDGVTNDITITFNYEYLGNTLDSAITYIQANRYLGNELQYTYFTDFDYYLLDTDNNTLSASMDYYNDVSISHMYLNNFVTHYDSTVVYDPNDYVDGTDGDYTVVSVDTTFMDIDCVYVDDVALTCQYQYFRLLEFTNKSTYSVSNSCDYLILSSSSMASLYFPFGNDELYNYFLANTLVFVPDDLLDDYKSDNNWSIIADRIYSINLLEVE